MGGPSFAFVAAIAIVTAASVGVLAQGGSPPGSATQTVITANASIRGRVVDRTGLPVRSAQVHARAVERNDIRVTTTDANGQYELRDLTSGGWTLRAAKAGFVSQSPTQASALDQDAPITLTNGQRATADIVLSRAGAIAGRVVDEYGDPVVGASVHAFRVRNLGYESRIVTSGAIDITDDTGAFRVFGLPPGTYFVGAVTRSTPASTANVVLVGTTPGALLIDEPTTYYPGTSSLDTAESLTLGAGQEQLGVSIVVQPPVRGVTVTGRIVRADAGTDGSPMVHLLKRGIATTSLQRGVPVAIRRADGSFMIPNVPPGDYILDASISQGPDRMEHGTVDLAVGTNDVHDVVVQTNRARALRVQISAESGLSLPRPLAMTFRLETPGSNPLGAMVSVTTSDSPELSLPGIIGVHAVSVTGLPSGWIIKSMEIAGSEIAAGPFDFSTVVPSAPLRIVISNRSGEVSGIVGTRDKPQRAAVVIFPEEEGKRRYPSRFLASGRSDEDGRYRVSGLIAESRYLAVAVSYLEPDEFQDPAFLQRMQKVAVPFSLRDGESRTLDLPLVER